MSERTLIGQLLNDNSVYYKLGLTAADFSEPRERKTFELIERMILEGKVADLQTVAMEQPPLLPSELSEATDGPPPAAAKQIADKVRENTRKKRIKSLAPWISDNVDSVSSDEAIEYISSQITDVQASRGDYQTMPVSDSLVEYVSLVEKRYNQGGDLPGISTGYAGVDSLTLGFQPQQYWIVAGRPSDGKSAAAVNMVKAIGLNGTPVGFLSLETSRSMILNRMVSDVANINSQSLMSGALGRQDFDRLTGGVDKLYEAPIYIYDKPNASLQDIQAECRRMVREWGVKVIFLDYIQLVQCQGDREYERVSNASMQLKSLWRSLDVTGVVLAQIHRHDHAKPTKSNLKGSGQIEQDADTVMLIHHDDEGAYWIFDKNRDGPTGEVEMYFDRDHVRFKEKGAF